MITVGLAAYTIYELYHAHVTRTAEQGAERLAAAIVNDHRQDLSAGRPLAGAARAALDEEMRRELALVSLIAVILVDRSGGLVYSTDESGRAMPDDVQRSAQRALAGMIVSRFGRQERGARSADIVESWVPVRDAGNIVGALRAVTDISESRGEFYRMFAVSMAVIVAVLGGAFAFLFVLIRSAVSRADAAHHDLETMAVTDGLTGLANRRYLMSRAVEECARIPRQRHRDPAKAGVGFIMADIDHFKAVNDTHGHLCGDDILRAIAERVRRVMRRYDIVGRYGGDEFLVVVPGTDFDETGTVAERIWQTVREEPFVINGAITTITISVGFTCAGDEDVTTALKRADEALYNAKHAGRDRVIAL